MSALALSGAGRRRAGGSSVRHQHRAAGQLELAVGDLRQRELRRQHLALLGHLHPARDRAGRLGVDRAVGRPAAAPQRAAAAVEEHPAHAVRARAPRRARPAPGRSPSPTRRSPRPCWSRSSRSSPPARRRPRAARRGRRAAPAASASSRRPRDSDSSASNSGTIRSSAPSPPAAASPLSFISSSTSSRCAGSSVPETTYDCTAPAWRPRSCEPSIAERPDDLLRRGARTRRGPTGSAAAARRSRARAGRSARPIPATRTPRGRRAPTAPPPSASPWRAACSRMSSRAKWKPNTSTCRIVSWSCVGGDELRARVAQRAAGRAAGRRAARPARRSRRRLAVRVARTRAATSEK